MRMTNITMRQMLDAGVHFGHQTRYWNPKMAPYIYGARNKVDIINLEKSLPMFQDALNFIGGIASKKGKILFVGTKRNAQKIIKEQAIKAGMPFVNHRWLGGMLTNYKTVRKSIKRLKELEKMQASGRFEKLIKKEALSLTREMNKLEQTLGGIKNMGGLPDVLFVIDVGYETIAVTEAKKLGIPIVGIVDTNHAPDGIDYIIPGNDDSYKSIQFYTENITDCIIAGRGTITTASKPKEGDEFVEIASDNDSPKPAKVAKAPKVSAVAAVAAVDKVDKVEKVEKKEKADKEVNPPKVSDEPKAASDKE